MTIYICLDFIHRDPNSPSGLSITWNSTSEEAPKYLSIDGDDTKMIDGLLYGSRINLWENLSKDC